MTTLSHETSDNRPPQAVWQYWSRYEIRGEKGSRYIYAPDLWRENGSWKKNESRTYAPLIRGGLFFKFARLGDDGGLDPAAARLEELDTDKNAQAAYDWADQWGVLGLTETSEGRADASTVGGAGDTVVRFAEEAWAANAVLRLYEAATRKKGGPDVAAIREIMEYGGMSKRWRSIYTSTPERTKDWALVSAANLTQERVTKYCYPALYRRPGHNHFRQAPAFLNLLGALWSEMFWLLLSEKTRRCGNPECNRVVPFEPTPARDFFAQNVRATGYATRVDKKYCDKSCANRHYYKTVTKPRRRAARSS
jgi:hypothetical protein